MARTSHGRKTWETHNLERRVDAFYAFSPIFALQKLKRSLTLYLIAYARTSLPLCQMRSRHIEHSYPKPHSQSSITLLPWWELAQDNNLIGPGQLFTYTNRTRSAWKQRETVFDFSIWGYFVFCHYVKTDKVDEFLIGVGQDYECV